MSLDNSIWLSGILVEAVVVGLLLYRKVWRRLPVFLVYCTWDLISNIVAFASAQFFHEHSARSPAYLAIYLVATIIDSVLQFSVLVELAWSVLRPIRASLPRFSLLAVCAVILSVGAAIWTFVAIPSLGSLPPSLHALVRLEQTVSILRILIFLALAAGSQLLSMGWRDRELQVITGLGLYSIVSLAVTMLQAHQVTRPQYIFLNRIVVVGFLCSLLYWIYSFAQPEAKRREFTPQMENLLLAVAGVARANRAALSTSALPERRYERKN
jgi:hypothetical protein